jgi:hypothetical protein
MEVIEIILSFLNIIVSWPFIVLIMFLILINYKPFSIFLNRIKRLEIENDKYKIKAQFKELKDLNAIVSTVTSPHTPETKSTELVSFQQQIELLADISPVSVIPFAFSQMVNKCSRSNEDLNNWKYDQNFINELMQDFYERKEIDKNVFTMFTNMKSIYQNVLFYKKTRRLINRQFAIEYGKCAETLMDLISTLD